MVAEASTFANDDKSSLEQVNARNRLENYTYKLRNAVPNDTNMTPKDKTAIGDAVKSIQSWLAGDGQSAQAADFNSKTKELEAVVRPIIARIQKEQAEKKK